MASDARTLGRSRPPGHAECGTSSGCGRAGRADTLAVSRLRGLAAVGLFSALLAVLLPIAAFANGQDNATGSAAGSEGIFAPFFQPPRNEPMRSPQWTVSLEGIVLGRLGGVNRTLVERVPGSTPFLATAIASGPEAFNADAFQQGWSAGPKIGVTYHGTSGYGAELVYFNVFNQGASKSIGPDNPADWLIMRAPGGFWQTQDFPYQAMTWSASTSLYSAEANGRFELSHRVTVLAGVRWLQLNDTLQGTLTPADRTAPTWKTTCPLCDLSQVTPGGSIGSLPPFWNTGTVNNLYGVQVGVDGKILQAGRLSLTGRIVAGLFDNSAQQSTGVSMRKIVYPSAAAANGIAFVSEASLQVKYRVLRGLSLKAGYEVLWLDGVALAPRQIDETYAAPSRARALGVNHASNVLFQGTTFGVDYAF